MIKLKAKLDNENNTFEMIRFCAKKTNTAEIFCTISRLFDEIEANTKMDRKEIFKTLKEFDKLWQEEFGSKGD